MAEQLLKSFALISLTLVLLSIITKILGKDQDILGLMGATTFTLFFMMLFMHLNNKSKNPSVILYVLTFLSAMIPIWFT